jgi:hypothetical protein
MHHVQVGELIAVDHFVGVNNVIANDLETSKI